MDPQTPPPDRLRPYPTVKCEYHGHDAHCRARRCDEPPGCGRAAGPAAPRRRLFSRTRGPGAGLPGILLPAALVAIVVLLPACRKKQAAPPSAAAASAAPAAAALIKPAPQQLADDLETVVDAYRRTIVLMSDEARLAPARRPYAVVVGKYLYESQLPRLWSLGERLQADMEQASASGFTVPLPLLETFLDTLESAGHWHDADKLVFRELVQDLRESAARLAAAAPAGLALLTRLQEDEKALAAIQALYDKELEKIFAQFRTRGMEVKRESWESYLAFLRTRCNAEAIMTEHQALYAAIVPPSTEKGNILSGAALPAKTLMLSFDDGPHPRNTQAILDILQRFQVKAVFFQLGSNLGRMRADGFVADKRAEISRRVLAAGHLIGNHTFTHPFLPGLSAEKVDGEFDASNRVFQSVDNTQPQLFRPPFGAYNAVVKSASAARNMRIMIWRIDSLDWSDPVPKSIANRVIAEARQLDHGVVLFHDIQNRTVEALPLVLETLLAEGYRFALWDGGRFIDRGEAQSAPPPPPAPEAAAVPLYHANWAVVVGINEYQHWPKLGHAVNDALAVRDLLVNRFGFPAQNVITLLDKEANRERILAALGDTLGNADRVDREDRVLFFYAGHGATRLLPSGRSIGYIVPVDADSGNLQSSCISMTQFQDINEVIPAKHLLYLMDACYGGLALTRAGDLAASSRQQYVQEITRRRARQMLTAGGADQQVADNGPNGHSIFTWTVLQGLEGRADLNNDGFITAAELFTYAGPLVSSLSRQTPAFGNLAGSEGGEFVFQVRHENEFLSGLTRQLDDEAIHLNQQLDETRRQIAARRAQIQSLHQELRAAQSELHRLDPAAATENPAEKARRLTDQGLARYREKKYDEALQAFQQAFALQPSNPQIANNIGFVHFRRGDPASAVQWYRKTLALDTGRAVAWVNLGEAYEALNQPQEAVKAYESFLRAAPATHKSAAFARERLAALRDRH